MDDTFIFIRAAFWIILLMPFAIVFYFLALIHYDFFWNKCWCKMVDFSHEHGCF